MFANIAVTAVDLLRRERTLHAQIGAESLYYRREQRNGCGSVRANCIVARFFHEIDMMSRIRRKHSCTFDLGSNAQQNSLHFRLINNRVRSPGVIRPRCRRPALQALRGIRKCILIRDVCETEALNTDGDALRIHHAKHRSESAILFANEVPRRVIEIQCAGSAPLDTHFVLDRGCRDAVSGADRTVIGNVKFRGRRTKLMPRVPAGAPSMRASTRCTMFSVRS